MIIGAMVYFVILNLLALTTAFKRKWTIASFIGLALNIIGTIYIVSQSTNEIATVLYVMFAFLVYTLIPIVGTYREKLKFKTSDIVLLAINTFLSSLIMYTLFYAYNWDDATGILSIIFAILYLLLGWLIEKKFSGEKHTQALFYLTGLTFVVLIIPFQFGINWLTLGWLVQGAGLTTYGILTDAKNFMRVGYIINGLCLWAFLIFDLVLQINFHFPWKYLAITIGSLIILAAYAYKKTLSSEWQKAYKYLTIINLWAYAMYVCYKLYERLELEFFNADYLINAFGVLLTFLIAYTLLRIKILSDLGTKIASIILYIIGIFGIFALNLDSPYSNDAPIIVIMLGTAALVIISLLSVYIVYDLMKLTVMEFKVGVEWYPMIVSAYFIIILTQNLITQYNFSFANAWISIIYVLTALAWIIFGFAKRYSFIRKAGLGLALLAVAKLFIIDLAALTQGYRIISYFVLGVTLVAISFVYQYFSKRLELKMETDNVSD